MGNRDSMEAYEDEESGDLSKLPWDQAVALLHRILKEDYAYADHKQIDWQHIWNRYEERVKQVTEAGDKEGFVLLLREFIAFTLRDGMVSIDPAEEECEAVDLGDAIARRINGFLGCLFHPVGDTPASCRVIVAHVAEGSSAMEAGILPGAEILEVDGKPAMQVVQTSKNILYELTECIASVHVLLKERCQSLGYGAEGTTIDIKYQNPNQDPQQCTLEFRPPPETTTYLEQWQEKGLMPKDDESEVGCRFDEPIDGVGLVRLWAMMEDTAQVFRDGLKDHLGCKALILDLRWNSGEDANVASKIMGHFFSEKAHMGTLERINDEGEYAQVAHLWSEIDSEPVFTGPLAIVVNCETKSAAELLALSLKRERNAMVFGHEETNGSMGFEMERCMAQLLMPLKFCVEFPISRMRDREGKILIATDHEGKGGVGLTHHFPHTPESLVDFVTKGEDFLVKAAVEALQEKKE